MILDSLDNRELYMSVHPLMKTFFDYVFEHNLIHAPAGQHIEVIADRLYINIDEMPMKRKDEQRIEVHRKYIDVQMALGTTEEMGWRMLSTLGNPDQPFDVERDIAFYSKSAASYFTFGPGQFVVFFPEDGHAPMIGQGVQRKIVGKLRCLP